MSANFNEGRAETATPGPFPGVTEEQAENYAAALIRERDGYIAKAKQCKSVGDTDGEDTYKDRAKQCEASLKNLGVSAKTAEKLAERRFGASPATGEPSAVTSDDEDDRTDDELREILTEEGVTFAPNTGRKKLLEKVAEIEAGN